MLSKLLPIHKSGRGGANWSGVRLTGCGFWDNVRDINVYELRCICVKLEPNEYFYDYGSFEANGGNDFINLGLKYFF